MRFYKNLPLLLGTLAGCSITGPNADIARDVDLAVRLQRFATPPGSLIPVSVLAPGDTVWVMVVAFNRSSHSIVLDNAFCGPLGFEVRNGQGARVSTAGLVACGSVSDVAGGEPSYRIAPGDSLWIGQRWTAILNFEGSWKADRSPLPAGEYTVTGGLVGPKMADGFVKRSRPVPLSLRGP